MENSTITIDDFVGDERVWKVGNQVPGNVTWEVPEGAGENVSGAKRERLARPTPHIYPSVSIYILVLKIIIFRFSVFVSLPALPRSRSIL